MSKKTITLRDVERDPTEAKRRGAQQAREQARFLVIEAKRRMCAGGKAVAWVDGKRVDAGRDSRTDLTVAGRG